MEEDASANCPACGALVAPNAVLCVACGYHLKSGHHLATVVEHEYDPAPDENPYASPMAANNEPSLPAGERPEFDLTERGARRARAIVADANSVLLAIFLISCCCAPGWLIMLPWYAYRFIGWHQLNSQFEELRHPNSFSPNGQLAVGFQDAKLKLLIGVIVGSFFWLIALIGLLMQALQIPLQR